MSPFGCTQPIPRCCSTPCWTAKAVYHPPDYSILGSVIEPSRLGRAFSWHTLSGYLGGALAPMVMLTLTDLWGMQAAIVTAGVLAWVAAIPLLLASALRR